MPGPYIIHRDGADTGDWTTTRARNKDEIISSLVHWLRSGHGEQIRIIYPATRRHPQGEEWV